MDSYRTFIAIELPRDLRARIAAHVDSLRRERPEVRASWTGEENLHLTLKFLGSVSVAAISKLADAVEAAAQAVKPFEFVVSGCGAFPTHGPPKVLWIGISDSVELGKLHEALEYECERSGFARDARRFHPHLTIARLRSRTGASGLAERHRDRAFDSSRVEVRELLLMRSELSSKGSRYTAIARHALG